MLYTRFLSFELTFNKVVLVIESNITMRFINKSVYFLEYISKTLFLTC